MRPVSYLRRDQGQLLREHMVAPARWAEANAEILEMIWDKFEQAGEWPQAADLNASGFKQVSGSTRRSSAARCQEYWASSTFLAARSSSPHALSYMCPLLVPHSTA